MTSPERAGKGWQIAGAVALFLIVAGCSATPASSPAVSSPPAPTETPTPQPSATPSASSGAETAEHCGASTFFQLAYDLPGMEAVEVTCGITYKQIDGLDVTLDLYLPADTDAATRLPVLVFVHGNDDLADPLQPIKEYWKRDGYTNGLIAAASGWAGVTFDYRGYLRSSPERLEAAQQDVLDLLAYLADQADDLRLDPTRICLWASSGGGLPAAWAAMRGEPRPSCVVTFSARLDGDAAPARDPVALIHADQPPFFVARGRLDRYAYQGSMRFVDRATEVGAVIVVEDHSGGHGFEQSREPDSERIIEAALDFLRAHLLARG